MLQSYKPLLAELGITYPQYLVMLVLWEQDGVSLKHLSERLGLDSGSVAAGQALGGSIVLDTPA